MNTRSFKHDGLQRLRQLSGVIGCALVLGAWLTATGCNRSGAETQAHAHVHAPAATFKEGHGIQLSAAGARFVALKTGDIATRKVGAVDNAVAIPAEALLRTVKGDFVYVVNGEWLLRTAVKVGASDEGWFELTDGLYEGDRIALSAARELWLAELHAVNGGVGCTHGH